MLNTQIQFLNYLKKVETEVSKINIPVDLQLLTEALKDIELLVPIIGAFNAGKSSLLNSFLEKDYLPVGITPETALATELRYSSAEYIEAVKADGSFEKYAITDLEEIKNKASLFKFLKMYINNDKLKIIEPLILVDMPGFESPLDLHNQAILEYINKGVHYIVLTSVEDGIITRSMVRQLSDIQEFGREFSFFLSKANLRADSEVKEVTETVKEQIEDHFDLSQDVVPIDNYGGKSLHKILTQIDPESLFKSLFITELKDNYYTITETINTSISALGKSKAENENAIVELKQAINELVKERDRMLAEAKEKYSDVKVNSIVEAVGTELSSSSDELVAAAINGGQEALSHLITEIVRHSLIINIKDSISEIGNEIVDNFSVNLSSINNAMSNFTISENWLNQMAANTKKMLQTVQSGISDIVNERKKKKNADQLYKAITTVLAVTTDIALPIIEIVIFFLPDLLSGIFKQRQQQQQKEQIRNTILTQLIPSIKRELRTKLPEIFNQQVQEVIVSISNNFESAIQEKQETIATTQRDIESKIADTEQTIAEYKDVNAKILVLANNTLFV